ncbi:MAG: hypothetical protein A2931_00055 [Candidatus Niyogibacteria bacterium RIFCSPLOWO2_01_FULL_45_48]|uniref:Uncharacterized protein n=2 Tax=Parcubacteria group TaxID=1794811 RepID=A0A1G1ZS21_9BACT|nr:MAG: hypothetical protein A3I24_00280 [Candidatus Harrisonbacteria bacterium RIFCSPLOWO2_02_FULL_41_13b]OGZ30012.1 MAG: hypothetical protein A2931_00055 [Candidatus Niyogibacteria bacterium RIFCSPLOWO2_01_FULL_45_48]OHB17305.1 MAG: hypothetical protein A2734_02065 [Parcubacteria group bacterium RIFCSPHIGHO2_01_FULL_40_30]
MTNPILGFIIFKVKIDLLQFRFPIFNRRWPMSHTIVVNADQDGAFAWKLPEDISRAVDSLGETNPLLAQTMLAISRNAVSQFIDVMKMALRNGMSVKDCILIIDENLEDLRAEMADLVNRQML